MERKLFEDNELIHAVIECNYEKVRELTLKKYKKPIYDIGGWEKQCPVFIISKAYQIIFEYYDDFEPFKKFVNDNDKILNLFSAQFSLGNIDDLLVEEYSGLYFETEKERTMQYTDAITNFDITDNLNECLAEEISGLRRSNIIKKLCELGADPYYIDFKGNEIMAKCEDDMLAGLYVVEKILKEPQEVYTNGMVVDIIGLARNIQNYEIMTIHGL